MVGSLRTGESRINTLHDLTLDLDTPQNIDFFVASFYEKLLKDDIMAPIFLRDANIDVSAHLPIISLYWQKMLWGDRQYDTNMMKKHRAVNVKKRFKTIHYQRWIGYFEQTAKESFAGRYTEKALRIANAVIHNMESRMVEADAVNVL
ncbi:MAG: group III truncated hemoglobin [Pseudomonadales bacterium]|nr:group III truncated hemoglobin [Pseudomonadales bacterium]